MLGCGMLNLLPGCSTGMQYRYCVNATKQTDSPSGQADRLHATSPSLPASHIPGPGASGLQVWP